MVQFTDSQLKARDNDNDSDLIPALHQSSDSFIMPE